MYMYYIILDTRSTILFLTAAAEVVMGLAIGIVFALVVIIFDTAQDNDDVVVVVLMVVMVAVDVVSNNHSYSHSHSSSIGTAQDVGAAVGLRDGADV